MPKYKESFECLALIRKYILKEYPTISSFFTKIKKRDSQYYLIAAGLGGVTPGFFNEVSKHLPGLSELASFEDTPYAILTKKGWDEYSKLNVEEKRFKRRPRKESTKSKTTKLHKIKAKVKKYKKIGEAARISRKPKVRSVQRQMPLTVITGLLEILRNNKLTEKLIEIGDYLKESNTHFSDVLRVSQID